MFENIIKMTDSYKVSHIHGYVKGLQKIQSYLESRGGRHERTLFFGLQYFIKRYLQGVVITAAKIEEASTFWNAHLGPDIFPKQAWYELLVAHGGRLPILIRAVPEGTLVPQKNVLMTIENTDERFPWLVNYLETLIMQVWYPVTIASQEYETRQNVLSYLEESGDSAGLSFKVHDFGYRGVTCPEQAALGAAAHLISFKGTDTVAGIELLQQYYGADMCGFSIPATEHSIMCSFGRDRELEACENWIDQYPKGIIACVSDTYNIYHCCSEIWGTKLKDKVMARNGTLVIRPDSGDYFDVIPKVLRILWDKFGGTVNSKNYRVLDSHVRVIQGDGMNPQTIQELYTHIIQLGWSADNLAVGSGGGLLMKVDRDTNKFAIKACAAMVNGEWIDIYKDPITDQGKKSKTGRQKLVRLNQAPLLDVWESTREDDEYYKNHPCQLIPVFSNGVHVVDYKLADIKRNAGIE
jgi:nicotinamide phosphoribosyltransferase